MTPSQSRLGKTTGSGGRMDGDGPPTVSAGEAATAYTLVGSSRHLRQDRGVETREKLIAAAIEVLSQEGYVAALEIRISERFNDDLNQQATRELGLISDERDRNWLEVFADSPLPRDQLVATRLFMLDVMRGLAVRQIETLRTVSVEPELALLRRMLAADISGETRRA